MIKEKPLSDEYIIGFYDGRKDSDEAFKEAVKKLKEKMIKMKLKIVNKEIDKIMGEFKNGNN